jgi:tetratricopeptide (TPR) repeat protein
MMSARLLFVWLSMAGAFAGSLETAHQHFKRTAYSEAIKVLLASGQQDAATADLTGRSYYMSGDFKPATEWLGKAVAAEPDNATYWLWLGRAYGRRAETSSPFTAPRYAMKTREAFEKAVALAPGNVEALNDLFSYYLEAPGFLGGGVEKAQALRSKISTLDRADGHFAAAQLAEKRKDFETAEKELRLAAEASPKQVGRVIDLAKFLAKRGRFAESDKMLERAGQIAPNNPRLLFDRARIYIDSKRNQELAAELLRQYMKQPLTPDHPPRYEAQRLLKKAEGG